MSDVQQKARRAVRRAIESGNMTVPETCEECGVNPGYGRSGVRLIQGHHYLGYDRPLEVQWLCVKCHRAVTPLPTGPRGPFPTISGARNPQAKLAESDVLAILARLATGEKGTVLGRQYGVSSKQISDIKLGRWWKHVPRPTALQDQRHEQ